MPEVVQSDPFTLRFTLSELDKMAKELLEASRGCKVWLFHGDLGAGKTTIIKSVCKALGVHSVMTSPTFSIVNEYESPNDKIYHFDFYRLKNENEAYDIGVDEYMDSGNYCFVEWPDRIPALVPQKHFFIKIIPLNDTTRKLEFRLHD